MSKISNSAAFAFENNFKFSRGNTTVFEGKMFLHGNLIADIDFEKMKLKICTQGWDTKTTLSRLNALKGVSVFKKKGILYLNGEIWDGEWKSV